MEWSSPSIILNIRPYGEINSIVTALSSDNGLFRGMVYGAQSRKQVATWQMGNFVSAHWSAALPEQLGTLKGELVHATAASVMQSFLTLSMMRSCCALTESCLLEHQSVPTIFQNLMILLTKLSHDPIEAEQKGIAALLRWELQLLKELGYGLDFTNCQKTNYNQSYWVSPKTGLAVTEEIAREWKPRLFRLPNLFLDESDFGTLEDWCEGLRMTGHFLERYIQEFRNRTLPAARIHLYDILNKRNAEKTS